MKATQRARRSATKKARPRQVTPKQIEERLALFVLLVQRKLDKLFRERSR